MPVFSLTLEEAQREIAEVEKALQEGYPPPGQVLLGRHEKTATRQAADALGVVPQSLIGRIGSPQKAGSAHRAYGIRVDWTLFRPTPDAGIIVVKEVAEPIPQPEPPPADPIEIRSLKDRLSRAEATAKEAERRAVAAENWRADVLGLHDLPPPPIRFGPRVDGKPLAETIVLFVSDLHWGERVKLDAMDGLNSFSLEIARKRLGRWTAAVCDLATKHWSGPKPDRIVLILGGDLISGAIHIDFLKTDELQPLPAVRDLAEHLRHAIETIHKTVGRPIDVISLPGNHGRSTLKPESKDSAITSHDMLVCDFLELGLKHREGISFYAPPSVDALFSVYGWRILATHGDRIGSRGGQGFVGPAATAARGFKKIVGDYAARGVHIDMILIGHFHCGMQLEEGFVNGALVGPSEYGRDARFRPRPATQLFLTIHPRRLNPQTRWIEVGDPSEGSIYEPPPGDRPLRPRYRVKAITEIK
jgi:hypothetical protein